ncbi:cubilin [Rhipicephalus sanguineus]|uniref:cubilin n=1 Tax=Rhipicephalus sanguineus TaxID=34632 RepID=UPI00189611F7|nr:cubilin [Rhipicephalus sanguineus]
MDAGLRFATFVAAAAAMLATSPTTAEYSSRDRPRIVLDNGNMVFQVPSAKNISFRTTSGRGGILLNGRDVAEVLAKVSEAARTIEPIATNTQLQELAETVETVTTLRSQMGQLSTKCQQLQTKVRRLEANFTRVVRVSINRLVTALRRLRNGLNQDPCASNPCSHGGTCIGRFNAFTCICPPSWEGPRCEVDVDECSHLAGSDLGCQNNARCINTPGSYRCECAQGFYGARCTESQDSCTTTSSHSLCDHGTCVSLPRTNNPPYMCLCEQGWTKGFGQPSCSVDVDECSTGHHFCSRNPPVACINYPGGFGCAPCPSGYSGDGYTCSDIDECLVNNGGCSQNPRVDCYNTVGSRFCGPCPPGYVGDGVSCSYVGACNVNNGGCSPIATCIVRSGTFHECRCPPGYVGNGVGPSGCLRQGEPGVGPSQPQPVPALPPVLDPCAAQPCRHGFCQVRGNDFLCVCETGYSGRLCDSTSDGCSSSPCLNNGTCSGGPAGGFVCSCTPDWTGPTCDEPRLSCDDTLYGINGTLRYPENGGQYTHKRDCRWIIQTKNEMVLNLTFTTFHLEEGHECAFDYLEIHDGPTSARRTIGRYCGTQLSGSSIVSSQSDLYLHFHSDSSVGADGFVIEWTSIEPQCGKVMPVANVGAVSSPGYPDHYPSNRDCLWTLAVPTGKRIQLHLATVQMEHHPNCSYDYLKIYDGATEQDRQLAVFCGTNNTASERPILSSGHNMLIQFHSDESSTDTGFYGTYAAVPSIPGCGGVMSRDKGRFTSPGHPNPYENGLLCEWEIRASPGERLRLVFERFDLESHPVCKWDALEVYDGSDDRSPLLRRMCGDSTPSPVLSTGSSLFLRFKTDENTRLQGFSALYETVCGGRWMGLQGELASPRYPSVYPRNRHCNYTILVPPGNVIRLAVQTFDVENDDNCNYDYLEISELARNGSTTRIGRYCGSSLPPVITSSYNQLRLVFHTDHSNEHHGFLANYTAVDVGCGGVLTESGSLASPATRSAASDHSDGGDDGASGGTGEAYRHNMICRWILRAPPGHTVRLSFTHFVIEDSSNCSYDYIEIHDTSDQMIGRYCGLKAPPTLTSSGRQLQVIFRTDDSVTREGFLAHFIFLNERTACGGDYYLSQGVIRSPLYPRAYLNDRDCSWVLHVPDGRQIRLNFTHFEIASDPSCRPSYLEILNGGQATSPLAGRFCQRNAPSNFVSDTNTLRLHFVSGSTQRAAGFEVYYDSALTGCGGTTGGASGSIVSPNYPQPYGHHAECKWNIRVNEGSRIALAVVDMDIERHQRCRYDALEIFDGASDRDKRLALLCNDQQRPGQLLSTRNDMFLRFRTDASTAGRGFHVVYSSDCNVHIKNKQHGVIESPNYPEPSPHNANCTWTIEAFTGHNISIAFSFFELEHDNNCTFDYVEVNETDSDGHPKRLGRFCGQISLPSTVVSSKNIVTVQYVTDGSVSSRGFRLEYAWRGCGGVLVKRTGIIETPNYPHGYPKNTECLWVIKAPLGQRVQLSFEDMHLESSSGCHFDFVRVYAGPDFTSPKIAEICSASSRVSELISPGGTMTVHFRSDLSIQGKGFRATYRFDRRGCGGRFSTPSAVIMSPGYPENYDAQDDCTWEIRVAQGHVVNLQILDFGMPASTNCSDSYLAVYDNLRAGGDKLLLRHCGDSLPDQVNITSTSNQLRLRMKASGISAGKGFKARYTTGCGATLNADMGGVFATKEYPHYSPDTECSWIIRTSQPNEQVSLTITHLSLPPNECTQSNVTVHDGDSFDSPVLHTLCTAQLPPVIVSRGGALLVHTSQAILRAHYGTFSSGCGGTTNSLEGNVASPGYPETYTPSVDCVWRINAAEGNMMLLTFSLFSLEESEFCNKDYLEIRERNAHGKLLGRFCGDETPMNITLANGLWIKFHSDDTDVAAGFSAHFATMRTVDLEGTSGVIESPLYPHDALALGIFTWRLHVPDDLYPRISWDTIFFTEQECWTSSLVLMDGIDEGSPEVAKYCGSRKPDPTVLRSSHVQLRFVSGGGYAKWKMRWEAVNSSYLPTMEQGSVCNFRVQLDNATSVTNISSPGFPESYTDYLNCSWSLVAPSRRVAKISFNVVDLRSWELIDNCFYDYINVYDVDPTTSSEQRNLRSICGQIAKADLPAPLVSSTRFMMLRFWSTDASRSEVIGKGFSASFQSVCGGNITEPSGVIQESDILDSEMLCRWRITSDRRVPLKITIESINLPSDGGACRETFIQVLNGGQSDSPPLGQGKFCGSSSRVQELPKTSSATAFITYRRNSPQKGQFRLRWEESGIECGGPVRLSREVKTRELTSPGYPHGAPAHAVTCDWTVSGPPRSRIRVDFPDSFHMRHGCHDEPNERRKDYVEVFDGGTANAPSLGLFCGSDRGDSLVSSGNLIALRYVQTNAAGDFLGFRSTVTLAECGGTLWPFNERSRNLEELREKLAEGSFFDCAWQLRSLDQTVAALTVRGLTLADSPGCTGMDFLEVRDGNRTGPVLAQICGPNSTLDVQSSENSMFLRVKLSSGTRHNPRSLTLRWHSEFSHCGGELTADEGTFTSPGFPRPLEERRHCYWTIAAPEGNRVSLSIDGNVNDCTAVLQIMERFYRRTVECGRALPFTYESFQSRIVVSYTFQRLAGGSGIRVTYGTTKELPCYQELTETSGTLEAPAEALTSSSHYGCEWTMALTPNQTLAVTMDNMNFTTTENANCRAEFLHVSLRKLKHVLSVPVGASLANRRRLAQRDITGRLCKQGDREVIVPQNEPISIHYSKAHNQSSGGFRASYRVNDCGGRLSIRDNMEFITTPRFPDDYPPNTDCVWIIEPDVWGTQVKLNFSSFSLEENCSLDWLDVKSGSNGLAPSVNQYCGQRSPTSLIGTSFMLIFHSDSVGTAKGFNISVSAVGLACGGLVHGRGEQSLQSPNYPNRYPANTECDWTVDVQKGYRALLAFRGRFDIEASTNCIADYVKVFNERPDGQWETLPVGSYCGIEAPAAIEATTHRARVLFRSNGDIQADGFRMVVTKACGDRYEEDEGEITSPRFPENYANNLNCSYLIVVPQGSHLELSFDSDNFELENHDTCKYDNLTLYAGNSTSSPVLGGPWCGVDAPGNYSVASSVLVMFRTDWSSSGKGFRLRYRISHCGGNLTAERGTFSLLPTMVDSDSGTSRCIWHIYAPEGRAVELRLQLGPDQHATHGTDCADAFVASHVRVLDGDSDLAPPIAVFCGRHGGPDTFKSTGRTMTVVLVVNQMYLVGTGFRASYRSTLGEKQGCGGTFRQESGALAPPSRDSSGSYPGGPLNCLWTIIARSGYGLELNVTALNLGSGTLPCNAASANMLEVWDSLDEHQEPLMRLCGQRPPEAPLRSAGNTLLVRFVTKAKGEGPGFAAAFKELPPLCGGSVNVSGDSWQTLQSPGYPNAAPANVRCLWVLRAQEPVIPSGAVQVFDTDDAFRDVTIRLKEMRLPCEDGAYLALITTQKYLQLPPVRLCGQSVPQEWLKPHASASRVQLLLDTGRRGGQAKLKLEYGSMADANLTYTQPSGVVHNVDYPGWTTITHPTMLTIAPVNATATSAIALYFVHFNVGNPVNGSCPIVFMQVRDGGASSRVLAHVCGDINPTPVFSTGSQLSVVVKNTATSHAMGGWAVRFFMVYYSSPAGAPAGCGGNVTANEGALSSPGYPTTFAQHQTCAWFVTGRARATLQLSFVAFAFNSTAADCDSNYLEVYNGHRDTPDAKITRLCGQDMPATLQSSGSQLLVKMTTNEKNTGVGFYARFKVQHDDQRTRIGSSPEV